MNCINLIFIEKKKSGYKLGFLQPEPNLSSW